MKHTTLPQGHPEGDGGKLLRNNGNYQNTTLFTVVAAKESEIAQEQGSRLSETSVHIYQTTLSYISQDNSLNTHLAVKVLNK
jgi:hypothetical protein